VITQAGADLSALHVVVPARGPAGAKTRLGMALDAEEREVLVVGMLAHTLELLRTWPARPVVHLVSEDLPTLTLAQAVLPGVRPIMESAPTNLNDALLTARQAASASGATAFLVLPADLPFLTHGALDSLVEAADAALAAGTGRAIVVIAPADARGGTNALLLSPPDIIEPQFGEASLEAHARAAAIAEASLQLVVDPALGFDLDTPDDLERLDTQVVLELMRRGEALLGRATRIASAAPAEAG